MLRLKIIMTCLDIMSLIFLRFFRGRKEKKELKTKYFQQFHWLIFTLPSDFGPILMFVELSFTSLEVDAMSFSIHEIITLGQFYEILNSPDHLMPQNSYYGFIYLMLYLH